MKITHFRQQFVRSLTYKPRKPLFREMKDMLPLISFPRNARKFKSAFGRRLKWSKQVPFDKECLTLSLTRYAVAMVGLGVLLVPFRLIATYMDKDVVVKTQNVSRSISRSIPNKLYSEEIRKSKKPIYDWKTGFVANKVHFTTEEAIEDIKIPCGENPIPESVELQEEMPPIDLTEECFLRVKVKVKKQKEPNCFEMPSIPSSDNDDIVVEESKPNEREPCLVKVKIPSLIPRKKNSLDTLKKMSVIAPLATEDKKNVTEPCVVKVKIPKYRGKNDKQSWPKGIKLP